MDPTQPLEWSRMFLGIQPPLYFLEIVVRVVVIYFFSLMVLKAAGKRSHKQTTPLELILLIGLGSAVGDVLFYPTVAVFYTMLIFFVIIVLQWITARVKMKNKHIEDFINSTATLVVREGVLLENTLTEENLAMDEVLSSLREAGVRNLGEVEYAFLELSGGISVFKYPHGMEKDGMSILPFPTSEKQ